MNISKYLVFLLLVVAGCLSQTQTTSTDNAQDTPAEVKGNSTIIEVTDSGFTPERIVVSKGTKVVWVNKANRKVWPASNRHPTHTNYPGGEYSESGTHAGSQACKGKGQPKGDAFDPCKRLKPGENYSFTFNEKGEWKYHDHLKPNVRGTVVVK